MKNKKGKLAATSAVAAIVIFGGCGGSESDAVATTAPAAEPLAVELLIQGGMIYDGDSDQPVVGDVGIVGDRIAFVGTTQRKVVAARTVSAQGMVVAPGFIDAHSHVDTDVFSTDAAKRLNAPFTTQGVTTAVIGNDGYGGYDIAAQAAKLRAAPPGTNIAMYVGFGPVRQSQLADDNVAPTAAQLEIMKGHVADAMCQGALGLSAGLYYTPQNFSTTEEVIEVAKVAARFGGLYDTHMRDEGSSNIGLKAAVAEALRIGAEAGMPVNISHIKALGVDVQGQAPDIIKLIQAEQAKGRKITADQYPWLASSTYFSAAVIPFWALAGGRTAMLARFNDATVLTQLKTDIAENIRVRGGAAALLFAAGNPAYVGKTLADVATTAGVAPVDAVMTVLRGSEMLVANFNQSDADVRTFMVQPWVITSSDSSTGHPRAYGSFAQKYAEYVVRQKTITLAQFVHSSSALTADTLGLTGRGRLKADYFADVVVLDPAKYKAMATYTSPAQLSVGVVMTLVNGQPTVENGATTGKASGRPLLRTVDAKLCPAA
ncbi:amidohydrolase [Cupriavidus pauculus]|uniref:Amidohydrolase n=1 Tax=Cupriavidus pauculus TaxID=82633 RepID=A0A2N5C5I9_9BURK|nr:amidohydrolase [Cupriavidus pauculus]